MTKRPWLPALVLALLVIPTCASLPTIARDGTTVARPLGFLPPLPDRAPTAFGTIPVRRVPNLQCLGKPAYGCFYRTTWVIEIRDSLPLPLAWASLHHELAHAAFQVAGVEFDDAAQEDQVADALAAQQVVEMRAGWPK